MRAPAPADPKDGIARLALFVGMLGLGDENALVHAQHLPDDEIAHSENFLGECISAGATVDVVEILLKKGAHVRSPDLIRALRTRDEALWDLLSSYSGKRTLEIAAEVLIEGSDYDDNFRFYVLKLADCSRLFARGDNLYQHIALQARNDYLRAAPSDARKKLAILNEYAPDDLRPYARRFNYNDVESAIALRLYPMPAADARHIYEGGLMTTADDRAKVLRIATNVIDDTGDKFDHWVNAV